MMDKKILIIIVMGIIILAGLFYFLIIPKYNLWQQTKGLEKVVEICQVSFIFNNQTRNITAVDCLRKNIENKI